MKSSFTNKKPKKEKVSQKSKSMLLNLREFFLESKEKVELKKQRKKSKR